ncbi:Ankyrin repeat-containing domain,Ankyrin repeat [Cinara cedri]|uniref:Ankyrin repeat-containing domain,Ankyrin repeat n=1 Tax=Cinara cedri TaxID=506608 RepID=A0A5E4M7T2_9HEMI|nr:Ankyrin repeat-containing domain,Ankyrin repeat [Cinara cedri]
MPLETESQFEKFDNTIAKISDDINSGKISYANIYEELKNQLRENVSTVYEEWKNSKFDPSFKFKLYDDFDDIIEKTLLHSAIDCTKEAACVPLVQYLLEKKADPNIRDSYNQTPLSSALYAREDKNKQVVKLLLDAGADQNAVDNDATYRRTPLSIACKGVREGFSIETIKLLLERGVNINDVVDNKGNIILHQLVEQSFSIPEKATTLQAQTSKLIKIVIEYGANIYANDNSSSSYTPEKLIANQLRGHIIYDKKFVASIQEFLKEQKKSVEYHHKLFEVVEQYQDLRSLTDIITENGPTSIRGIQVCSKAVPQALGIPGIKLVVMVDGEFKQEFSQGTGYPVISVEVGSLRRCLEII